jgi:hypothetical protein
LTTILLGNNELSALHPQMFSHLKNLDRLDLSDNNCIDKDFWDNFSNAAFELEGCRTGYALQELQNLIVTGFEEAKNRNDEKFENLKKRFEEMEKKFDKRSEKIAKEVKEIKRMVEKIYKMTTSN